jgi:eukaryotic-like serine/threonine-protein kinase
LKELSNFGELYVNQGKYAEAEATFNRVLETMYRVLGDARPQTLATMNHLGSVRWYQGNYAGAEQLLTRALDGDRRVFGKEHPRTLSTLVWLGRTRLQQRRYDLSEASFREALAAYQRTKPEAWERYNSESLLGQSLAAAGKFTDAEPLLISGYQGLLQRRAKIPAVSQPDVGSAVDQIVRLYEAWLKPDKAAEWRAKLKTELPAPK